MVITAVEGGYYYVALWVKGGNDFSKINPNWTVGVFIAALGFVTPCNID